MNPRSAPSCSATMTRECGEREPLEPLDDVARAGRVALVGEQRGDRVGVVGSAARRVTAAVGHVVGHGAMVPGASPRRGRCGPSRRAVEQQPLRTERTGPRGRGDALRGDRPAPARRRASQTAAGPSPWRASVAASRPSVEGSRSDERADRGRPPVERDAGSARRGARRRARPSNGAERPATASRIDARPGPARPSPSRPRPRAPSRPATPRASGRAPPRPRPRSRPSNGSLTRPAAGPGPAARRARSRPAGTAGWRPSLSAKTPRWIQSLPAATASAAAAAVTSSPRPRPRAQSAVPIDDR